MKRRPTSERLIAFATDGVAIFLLPDLLLEAYKSRPISSDHRVHNLEASQIDIVDFHQSDSDDDVSAAYNCGVVTRWQVCDNRRLAWLRRR